MTENFHLWTTEHRRCLLVVYFIFSRNSLPCLFHVSLISIRKFYPDWIPCPSFVLYYFVCKEKLRSQHRSISLCCTFSVWRGILGSACPVKRSRIFDTLIHSPDKAFYVVAMVHCSISLAIKVMVLTLCFFLYMTGFSGVINPSNMCTWEIPSYAHEIHDVYRMDMTWQLSCGQDDHIFGESLSLQNSYRLQQSLRPVLSDGSPWKWASTLELHLR